MKILILVLLAGCVPEIFRAKVGECYIHKGNIYKVTEVGEHSFIVENKEYRITAPHSSLEYQFKQVDCWE